MSSPTSARRATRAPSTAAEVGVCERAAARVAAPAEPPARLHGDLWSGNVLWAPDGAWLIDPAAHGGHRETDLAMLALFGCPHLDAVLAAYDEAAPLADGWRARVPTHQLFPLLVHVVLFGRGPTRGRRWRPPARCRDLGGTDRSWQPPMRAARRDQPAP